MTCIWFVNPTTGFATGYQTILKTTNTGSSWELSLNAALGGYLFGIYFINVNTGFVVGNNGYIYKTTDSGSNWIHFQPQEYNTSLSSVWFISANTGFVVGGDANNIGNNKIFKTTNCGNSWDSVIHPLSAFHLFSVRFVNVNTGFITGWNRLLKSTDSGLNWYTLPLPIPEQNDFDPAGTFFTNASTGYIAGSANAPLSVGIVLKTTTGGEPLGIKPISNEIPDRFSLNQNYPNPFNPAFYDEERKANYNVSFITLTIKIFYGIVILDDVAT